MTIAIDWDGSFTEDPALWLTFALEARKRSHRVIIVTGRKASEHAELVENTPVWMELFFTGGQTKDRFMRKQGIIVDVWIDNDPWTIAPENNIKLSPDSEL